MRIDGVQQVYDDFDEAWVPRALYDACKREVQQLLEQVTQLQDELGALERRLAQWKEHA